MATGTLPNVNKAGLGELFSRLRFVLLAIIVYRIGTHIPVPGIDPAQLAASTAVASIFLNLDETVTKE